MLLVLMRRGKKGKLDMEQNHACRCVGYAYETAGQPGERPYVGHQSDWHAWRMEQPGNTAPPKVSTEPQRRRVL